MHLIWKKSEGMLSLFNPNQKIKYLNYVKKIIL